MPLNLLAAVLLQIGLSLLARLFGPRLPRRKSAPFASPTVEEGGPIGKGFGLFQVAGVVTAVREGENVPDDDNEITFYLAKLQLAPCWGPIHQIVDIVTDERALSLQKPNRLQSLHGHEPLVTSPSLSAGPLTFTDSNPIAIAIAARQIFGGQLQEGGLHGEVRVYPGVDDQPIDDLILGALGDRASAYPHMVHAVFGQQFGVDTSSPDLLDKFLWCANTPTPKPISFIFAYYPNTLLGDDGKVGQDANPAEVLFDIFTNGVWGKNESASTFDLPQWRESARQLRLEGRGISEFVVDRTLEDFVDDVKSHIQGELVESPVTGLIQLKLARRGYVLSELLEVTKNNSYNFRQGKAQFAQTFNEIKVKYRKYMNGGDPGRLDDFVLYTVDSDAANAYLITVQSPGRNISNVSATITRGATTTTLDPSVYKYHADDGWFIFSTEPQVYTDWEIGDIIKVSFDYAPLFAGFVDATATSQNPANRQVTGRVRSQTFDYPMFTTAPAAQAMADFLRLTMSRPLDVFSWTMGREGAHLTALDVVRMNEPEYGLVNVPVRITKITVGPPEHPDTIFEGAKDVFAEEVLALSGGGNLVQPPTTLTAPPMASFYCAGEDVLQFQASDSTFLIEIERADDVAGTGAEEVEDSPFVGTTITWTDPTPGKAHRARLIRADADPGPWTEWLAACDAGTDDCVEPVITDDALIDGLVGTLTITVVDTQARLYDVQVQVIEADGTIGAWTVLTGPSYEQDVDLVAGLTSYIGRRVRFYNCSGELVTREKIFPFTVPVEPPVEPPIGLVSVLDDLVVVTANAPLNLLDLPSERTIVKDGRACSIKYPFDQAVALRVFAVIEVAGPVGSYLAFDGEVPGGEGVFLPMGEDNLGPILYVDEASLDLLDAGGAHLIPKRWVVTGTSVPIRGELKADTRAQLMVGGGDDATGEIYASRVSLQIVSSSADVPDPEPHPVPPDAPGSCDVPSTLDDFGDYADLAAFDAAWPED